MKEKGFCTIQNKTKGKLPRLPFVSIKKEILGEDYQLGLTLLTPKEQQKINFQTRGKNETTNILSFVLTKKTGEIIVDPIKIKKDAPLFNMSYTQFFKFLFIHGCLHLKGFEHSSKMDKLEQKYLKIFSKK